MHATGGDWTRRHARLGSGEDEETEAGDCLVSADPPEDDWRARHAWCRRS